MEQTAYISATRGNRFKRRLKYAAKCLPPYFWQKCTRRAPKGGVHVIVCVADHFEPSSLAGNFAGYAPMEVQQRRVEDWCSRYPRSFDRLRDADGRAFTHTYFYPAEQYDRGLVQQVADLCHSGWGELEIHLHHGLDAPATAAETRQQLVLFRDALAAAHGCLSYSAGDNTPKYAFVHGNFSLANSANGFACGVDDEMQILAETGCFVDMTYPTSAFHPAQIAKLNSMYECALPLHCRAPQRRGRVLSVGRPVSILPYIVQGPWALDFDRSARNGYGRIEDGALTAANPPSLHRLQLWKRAGITVEGRPDWVFVKLDAHGMYPGDTEILLGPATQHFLLEIIEGASGRRETVHFVSAREMANIALAACDGHEGNPGDYRDYRYRLAKDMPAHSEKMETVMAEKR